MTDETKRILDAALRLPIDARAVIAAELLASMDEEPTEDVQAAWAAEIERRARRMLSGEDQGRPWDEVRQELRAEFRRG